MSEVKVNKISPRTNCGTTQLGDAGDTITVTGDLKSNSIKSASGSTITLGQSGDTITLASGASQSGFGRTGTVDWQTGDIKTATFTATNGEGYFCNTTSGAFTVNLPAGSAGAIVSVSDYTRTFATNNLTISPNGSEKIGGIAADATLDTNGQSATFVYVDSTEGWINVQNAENTTTGVSPYIIASGGTITTCGDCKIHTFTGPGTFTVCNVAGTCAPTRNQVSYMVVAGGGSGAPNAGGGGAGGFRENKAPLTPYTASPLEGAGDITVTQTAYPITVGAGGSYPGSGTPGVNSIFSTITSAGGGNGAQGCSGATGASGGSGGGGANNGNGSNGGAGNTPPVSPPQGNNGGGTGTAGPGFGRGGGGGAGAVGGTGTGSAGTGAGGNGVTSSINGTATTRAGGGGGGNNAGPAAGGSGGGGATDVAGTANTGGGGGGGGTGANGGSGVVIIRYKYQ